MMIDLQQFCAKYDVEFLMTTPFNQGDFTYATDGFIIVRVPRRAEFAERTRIGLDKLPWDCADAFVAPLTPIKIPQGHFGTGEISAYADYSIDLRGIPFRADYVVKLMALPHLEIAETPQVFKPLRFRFAGGDGLLMPLRSRSRKHISPVEAAAP